MPEHLFSTFKLSSSIPPAREPRLHLLATIARRSSYRSGSYANRRIHLCCRRGAKVSTPNCTLHLDIFSQPPPPHAWEQLNLESPTDRFPHNQQAQRRNLQKDQEIKEESEGRRRRSYRRQRWGSDNQRKGGCGERVARGDGPGRGRGDARRRRGKWKRQDGGREEI